MKDEDLRRTNEDTIQRLPALSLSFLYVISISTYKPNSISCASNDCLPLSLMPMPFFLFLSLSHLGPRETLLPVSRNPPIFLLPTTASAQLQLNAPSPLPSTNSFQTPPLFNFIPRPHQSVQRLKGNNDVLLRFLPCFELTELLLPSSSRSWDRSVPSSRRRRSVENGSEDDSSLWVDGSCSGAFAEGQSAATGERERKEEIRLSSKRNRRLPHAKLTVLSLTYSMSSCIKRSSQACRCCC